MANSNQQQRQQGRRARRALTRAYRRRHTAQIHRRLLLALRPFHRVALYLHFDGEPNLDSLIQTLHRQGKCVYLPCVNKRSYSKKTMQFRRWNSQQSLCPSQFGIQQPKANSPVINSKRLQAMVMPLTAFDEQGARLGMGAGFYDRHLGWQRFYTRHIGPTLIGCAWQCQGVSTIKTQAWDRPLNQLITEKHHYTFR